jgi:alpha-ketoglutarate-dependent taurine dioxygenase
MIARAQVRRGNDALQSREGSRLREISPSSDQASFSALLDRVAAERTAWADELRQCGALLLRGYRVDTVEEFAELVSLIADQRDLRHYQGGASPRKTVLGGTRPVYNSTEYPPECELPLHNELSYSDDYPERVYFLCLTEPEAGGETTLGDSRQILASMPASVRSEFERKGVRYIRNLAPGSGTGYSWQDAFGSEDPGEVEARCAALGAEFEWLAGGYLRLVQTRPAFAIHPDTGDEVWFNQADGFHPTCLDPATYRELLQICGSEDRFRLNVTFGDGSAISPDALASVRDVMRRETRPHVWRKGDVLVLDNLLTAHGRRPFRGARRIAAAMS